MSAEDAGGTELFVERLIPGGAGLARLPDGRSVIVPNGAPGERIRIAELVKERGAWLAKRYNVVEASPSRITPECPFAETCGGCDVMHLARASELEQKSLMLRDSLGRVSGVTIEPQPMVAGEANAYRTRARFHIQHGKVGFFGRGTHRLEPVASCLVSDPAINVALKVIRKLGRRFPQALEAFSEVELRATEAGVIARFTAAEGLRPIAAEPFLRALGSHMRVATTDREAQAMSERRTARDGTFVEIPADVFSQVNPEINVKLVQAVLDGALSRKLTSFCDLFAGVGNFALPLAKAGLSGVMVELSPSAVEAARRAIAEQNVAARLKARAADAARGVSDLIREQRTFDLVLLDPPREGAANVVGELKRLGPRAIAYVSCDASTLARDLKPLLEAGFSLASVQPFDMFPRTHHFETLVWLEA